MPALDLAADPVALTAALVDVPSVSGDERALADAVEAALRALPHLEVAARRRRRARPHRPRPRPRGCCSPGTSTPCRSPTTCPAAATATCSTAAAPAT